MTGPAAQVAEQHLRHLRALSVATQAVHDHGAHQKPGELAVLLELVGPASTVVEVGCDRGGTLWAFGQTGARVLGVTLQGGWFGSGAPLYGHGATVVMGDSHDPDTLRTLRFHLRRELACGGVDLVLIDADHRYQAVLADFNTFAPLVRPGGVVALHDVCHHEPVQVPGHGVVEVGVERLWRELRAHFPNTREVVHEPTTWGGLGLVTM